MRTATRTAARAAAALAIAVAAGLLAGPACSYAELTSAVEVNISNIPATANRLEVTLTDSAANPHVANPHFGPGVYNGQSLLVQFPAPATGVFTIKADAFDVDQTPLGTATVTGNYDGTTVAVTSLALVGSGLQGTFGTPCILASGAANTCSGGLSCKQYTGGERGFCTQSCTGTVCTGGPSPQASCQAFGGGSSFCQWECDLADGGTSPCPEGLACTASVGAKKYCTAQN